MPEGNLILEVNTRTLECCHQALAFALEKLSQELEAAGISFWLDFGTLLGAVREARFIPWDDDVDIGILEKDLERFRGAVRSHLTEYFVLREQSNSYPLTIPLKLELRGTHTIEKALLERGVGREFHYGLAIDVFTVAEGNGFSAPRISRRIINRSWQVKQIAGFVDFDLTTHFSVLEAAAVRLLRRTPRAFIEWATRINNIDCFRSPRRRKFLTYTFRSNFWKYKFHFGQIFPLAYITFAGNLYPIPNSYRAHLEMLYGDSYMFPPELKLRHTHSSVIEIEHTSPFYAHFGVQGHVIDGDG